MPSEIEEQQQFMRLPGVNRSRMAHHEAGHAVVALVVGLRLIEVQIGERDGYSEHEPKDDAELFAQRGEIEARRALVVMQLAGWCAQHAWDSRCGAFGCEGDAEKVAFNLKPLGELTNRWQFDELKAESERLVAAHWGAISRLAGELLVLGTLSGNQAAEIAGIKNN